jgi:hypothetical protein
MKPIMFKQANTTFAKDQKEYIPLPAHRTENGIVTSCWKLSLFESIKLLFTKKIYVSIMTYNNKLQPQLLKTKPPEDK